MKIQGIDSGKTGLGDFTNRTLNSARVPMPSEDPAPFTTDDTQQKRFEYIFDQVSQKIQATAPVADVSSGDVVVKTSNGVQTISGRRSHEYLPGFSAWRDTVVFPQPFSEPPSVILTAEEVTETEFTAYTYLDASLYAVSATGFQFRVTCEAGHQRAILNFRAEGKL